MGGIAIALAAAAAVWLIYSSVRGGAQRGFIMKLVVWLTLSAVAFAAKLWPIALMLLLGAGAVALIERFKPEPPTPGRSAPPAGGPMSVEEARAVLGLGPDAGLEEVDPAYRRLIAKVHPDGGGTDYLAAQINRAREVLKRALAAPADD